MSTNITATEVLGESTLTLTGKQVAEFRKLRDLPEIHPFEDLPKRLQADKDYDLDPKWQSTWSGNSFDVLKERILPATRGSADIVYTWEGGEFHTGIRVRDGVVTEHEVVFALGEKLE